MKNIVVGFDGTGEAKHAIRVAAELAQRDGALLFIVYAMPSLAQGLDASAASVSEYARTIRLGMEEKLAQIQREVSRPGLAIETAVLEGVSPARRIAEFAEAKKADLVVVGSHGQGALSRFFLGSVADGLVHAAPCSVLVVR